MSDETAFADALAWIDSDPIEEEPDPRWKVALLGARPSRAVGRSPRLVTFSMKLPTEIHQAVRREAEKQGLSKQRLMEDLLIRGIAERLAVTYDDIRARVG